MDWEGNPRAFCQLSRVVSRGFSAASQIWCGRVQTQVETCGTPSTLCPGWVLSGGDERRHGGA
jgi:hypothetical protein